MLHEFGYCLQALQKTLEGTAHPDRNAQFEHINATATAFLQRQQPVISVDTKKKELIGDCKTGGREWQPSGLPEPVRVDFPGDAVGKAIPYAVYDMAGNEAWVSVGWDHDTPAFAVAAIRQWWTMMGCQASPAATALYITADAGGSNGDRSRAWKAGPPAPRRRAPAHHSRVALSVGDGQVEQDRTPALLPPHGELRGRALLTFETLVELIGHTHRRPQDSA